MLVILPTAEAKSSSGTDPSYSSRWVSLSRDFLEKGLVDMLEDGFLDPWVSLLTPDVLDVHVMVSFNQSCRVKVHMYL
jgi:hypothetical protein